METSYNPKAPPHNRAEIYTISKGMKREESMIMDRITMTKDPHAQRLKPQRLMILPVKNMAESAPNPKHMDMAAKISAPMAKASLITGATAAQGDTTDPEQKNKK